MDPGTDVYQTEQPQISYSFDFTAEQSRAIQSPDLLGGYRVRVPVSRLGPDFRAYIIT